MAVHRAVFFMRGLLVVGAEGRLAAHSLEQELSRCFSSADPQVNPNEAGADPQAQWRS